MADENTLVSNDADRFTEISAKLLQITYRDDERTKTDLNLLLDELNSLNYCPKFVTTEDGNRVVDKLPYLVPFHRELLVTKICHLMVNVVARQQLLIDDRNLHKCLEFVLQALERCSPWTIPDCLQALSALLYESGGKITKYHEALLGERGVLIQLAEQSTGSDHEDVLRGAVQCLENICMRTPGCQYLDGEYLEKCYQIFLKTLHTPAAPGSNEVVFCKTVICAIRGLQHILLVTKSIPSAHIGPILAALRAFMLHGFLSQPVPIPVSLYPTPLPQSDPAPAKVQQAKSENGDKKTDSAKNDGKKPRKRRPNKKNKGKGEEPKQDETLNQSKDSGSTIQNGGSVLERSDVTGPGQTVWPFMSTSESEFSDTEGGQLSKTRALHTRLRQWAFGCLHAVIKVTDKKVLFGYWSSFLPDSPHTGNSGPSMTLFTSALKDPSPKCRMGALSALTALFDGTKPYLAVAEDSVQHSAAFTPYSVVLGSMVKEVHRCLLLGLVAENYPLTITQLIKCLATVVANVSYHRLNPGLLSRVIKQIRHFLYHRDPNIRVACLTCLGSMASVQPPLLEVCHIITPPKPPVSGRPHPATEAKTSISGENLKPDSGFQSGDNSTAEAPPGENSHSGGATPGPASGTITPVFSEQSLQAHSKDTSWVIKMCIKNVLPQPNRNSATGEDTVFIEPLPVRLESLQVLANLCKGYFPIIRNSLPLLKELVHKCLEDVDPTVRLHGSKLLNELGVAILSDTQNSNTDSTQRLTLPQALEFWLGLLNGPLPGLLQSSSNPPVKAALCDCLADLGPDLFSMLPVDKRILCVTLALGLVCDEDAHLRAASVRCLGVYSLYPVLREDVSFIADSANVILTCLSDANINVRAKAAWSLGNLSDALVLNKSCCPEFVEDFSDMLLLKLLTTASKSTQDNEKVRASSVRAVGNLLHYLPSRCIAKSNFSAAISESIGNVLRNINMGTMKVRWNACHAMKNLFLNQLLPHGKAEWTDELIRVLTSVVRDCKNFKVRINAALALGAPLSREHYGTKAHYVTVWGSLLGALQTADTAMDFAEYKYRDHLNEQLCNTLLHAACLVTVEDLDAVQPDLSEKLDQLIPHVERWKKTGAANSKDQLISDLSLTLERLWLQDLTITQKECVDQLAILYSIITEKEVTDVDKPQKTAFKQTYD